MIGIVPLYHSFAQSHVELYQKKGKVKKISRAKVELQILSEIEKAEYPIDCKMAWYHAVLASSIFDGFWIPVTVRNKLPKSCTARYVTDKTWLQFEAPTEDDVEKVTEEGAEDELEYEADDDVGDEIHNETRDDATAGKVTNHQPRPPSPDFDQSSSSSESETDHLTDAEFLKYAALQPKYKPPHLAWKCDRCNEFGHTASICPMNQDDDDVDYSSDASSQVGGHEGKELAKRLGAAPSMWPEHANEPVNKAVDEAVNELHDLHEDARASLVDVNGLAREEGDDGAYEDSPSKSKGKGKAQATPTVKGASKPKGVTKNRAAPKKKEQTSAQLLTAAAKSREPPKIKRASTKRATPKKEQTPAQLNTAIAETLESAKPKATEKASTIPSQAATTPVATPAHVSYNGNKNQSPAATVPDEIDQKIARVQASMGPAQERGIKRTLEQLPDDEEDSPATKKAKVGSAVSVNGGRKKATPKKSKQKGLQEWDGVPRGFGEYHNY